MVEQGDKGVAPSSGKRELAGQGVRYLLVGGSSALIELALFHLLHSVLSLAVAPANITAIVVATAYNFLLNRSFTFKSTSHPVRSLVLYIILFAVNMAFSTIVIGALRGRSPSAGPGPCGGRPRPGHGGRPEMYQRESSRIVFAGPRRAPRNPAPGAGGGIPPFARENPVLLLGLPRPSWNTPSSRTRRTSAPGRSGRVDPARRCSRTGNLPFTSWQHPSACLAAWWKGETADGRRLTGRGGPLRVDPTVRGEGPW